MTFVSHFLISLRRNAIGPAGAEAIAEALKSNTALTTLK